MSNNYVWSYNVVAEASQHYDHVLFVDGNHDHYNMPALEENYDIKRGIKAYLTQGLPNVTFLYGFKGFKVFEKTAFFGHNGWYDFKVGFGSFKDQFENWKEGMNDYKNITFKDGEWPHELAKSQANDLSKMVAEAQDDDSIEEIVIVTHTIPTPSGLMDNRPYNWMKIDGAFVNTMMNGVVVNDVKKKIKVWTFGHTHHQQDYVENGIRYVCNPRGYRGEGSYNHYRGIIQIDTSDTLGSAFGEIED